MSHRPFDSVAVGSGHFLTSYRLLRHSVPPATNLGLSADSVAVRALITGESSNIFVGQVCLIILSSSCTRSQILDAPPCQVTSHGHIARSHRHVPIVMPHRMYMRTTRAYTTTTSANFLWTFFSRCGCCGYLFAGRSFDKSNIRAVVAPNFMFERTTLHRPMMQVLVIS